MIDMIEVTQKLPKECPFCRNVDEMEWTELEVFASEPFYVDVKTNKTHPPKKGVIMHIFCTRCEEEIREEDCQ